MSRRLFVFALLTVCLSGTACSHRDDSTVAPARNSSTAGETPSTGGAPTAPSAGQSTAAGAGFTRPSLVEKSGSYFKWSMPEDWTSNETSNGVDMKSKDGTLFASSVLLIGSMGQTTPWDFLSDVLPHARAKDLKKLSSTDLPGQPSGYPGISWQVQRIEITFTDENGAPKEGDFTVGILNAYGGYSVLMESYSAPPNVFDQAKTWLPVLSHSVIALNPEKLGNRNTVMMPRNHPLDNSPLLESWRLKGISEAKISQAQRESTMGYERMVSPINGEHYNMPFELYDGPMGGYRDPANPNEILKKAPVGE